MAVPGPCHCGLIQAGSLLRAVVAPSSAAELVQSEASTSATYTPTTPRSSELASWVNVPWLRG